MTQLMFGISPLQVESPDVSWFINQKKLYIVVFIVIFSIKPETFTKFEVNVTVQGGLTLYVASGLG